MAELLRKQLNVDARIVSGGLNEFTVLVDGQVVSKKGWFLRPRDEAVVEAVRRALAA